MAILGQALAGHPSWGAGQPRLGQLPKPPNILGRILGGHPSWGAGQPGNIPQPHAPGLPGPGAPGSPSGGAPAAAGGAPAGPQQPSPLDSTYYQNVADYLFKTNNAINADQAKIGQNQTALQSALGQLAYQQPRSDLALEQHANAGGGLYSSVYNQNLGDLNQKFLTSKNADETRFGNAIQALAAEISGLRGSIPLYESGQAEGAAQRAAAAAQANPALGALPPPAPGAPPAPAPGGGGAPAGGAPHGGSAQRNILGQILAGHPSWNPQRGRRR